MAIPKQIFQTHKSLGYIAANGELARAQQSWSTRPGFEHFFYDDNACDIFMEKFFPDIIDAYNKVPYRVMKADLWRYCVIYKYGGIYADADTICNKNPSFLTDHEDKQLVVATEDYRGLAFFCQWVFAAPPNSPILRNIIDLSVNRIRSSKSFTSGHSVHHATGPAVFTDAILKQIANRIRSTHESIWANTPDWARVHDGGPGGVITRYACPHRVLKVGSSKSVDKTVSLTSPIPKDACIVSVQADLDQFAYETDGRQLTVTRTDANTGWGQNLTLYSINSESGIVIFPGYIFHAQFINHLFYGRKRDGWKHRAGGVFFARTHKNQPYKNRPSKNWPSKNRPSKNRPPKNRSHRVWPVKPHHETSTNLPRYLGPRVSQFRRPLHHLPSRPRHRHPRHRHPRPRSYQPRRYQPRRYQPRRYQPRRYQPRATGIRRLLLNRA